MTARRASAALTILLATGLIGAAHAQGSDLPAGFGETTLASGFDRPVAVDWAPTGACS